MEHPCDNCEILEPPIFFCGECEHYFCAPCWETQLLHKPGKQVNGIIHEKALPDVISRLRAVFDPPSDPTTQERLHLEDEDTKWFGIARGSANRPIFQDYGRYATILANSATGEHTIWFPRLVSFIGQTGAGKSTLVKILIERKLSSFEGSHLFPTPVIGTVNNDNVPTSGDVHLTPIRPPPSACSLCYTRTVKGDPSPDGGRLKKRFRLSRGTQRDIAWADSPEKQKREYGVMELYPRLLYTFSDVIVFVLQNPKTFQSSVLSKLIDWADAIIEKSTNQPVLPHAIIALNASDPRLDERQWEVDFSTQTLMDNVSETIWQDEKYRKYAEYWRNRGKSVQTMEDLLRCYYSSVRVVRIPRNRYMLIENQVAKLYNEINVACEASYDAKRKSRMLANTDELHQYLQAAFDHFSQDLNTPFNFIEVAFRNSPIPRDFGGNILKLAVLMLTVSEHPNVSNLFESLSVMVASCIVLDLARHGLKGPARELFERNYMTFCDDALRDFCKMFWPCEFSNRMGNCVNVLEGHKKGHQNKKGKIIGSGDYISAFSFDTHLPIWRRSIMLNVIRFQKKIAEDMRYRPNVSERDLVSELHRNNIQDFYRRNKGANRFFSHTACLCCLRGLAQHPIDCGHVLCTSCVRAVSDLDDQAARQPKHKHSIILNRCPLHQHNVWFTEPWEIKLKPDLAGIRILSLDGGGIRGIVELEVLRALELHLGGRIPIQSFFDLIVGTSTGGILAMGLGVENWAVETCIEHFTKLCDKAFTWRLPGVRLGRKYRTRPFEDCLRDVLHDEYMFGGLHEEPSSYHRRVAVTSTSDTGQIPLILTNYNREIENQRSYNLVRPDNPMNELKLWEALRATSAAPGYFKPFVKKETLQGFLDGALYHNNPVRVAYHESKLLWPEISNYQPDILLSIGTGHNGVETTGSAEPYEKRWRRAEIISDIIVTPSPRERKFRLGEWIKGTELGQNLSVMVNRVDNILNSDQAWDDFKKDCLPSAGSPDTRRYQRINPKLGFRPPNLDDKGQLIHLQSIVRSKLKEDDRYRKKISRVAHQLVASSFYFERLDVNRRENGYRCRGKILCKFQNGSDEVRHLGSFLKNHQLADEFQPYFSVREEHRTAPQYESKYAISPTIIERMCTHAFFDMELVSVNESEKHGAITIAMALWDVWRGPDVIPISGFPRNLVLDALHQTGESSPSPILENTQARPRPPTRPRRSGNGKEREVTIEGEDRPLSLFDVLEDGDEDNASTTTNLAPTEGADWTERQANISAPRVNKGPASISPAPTSNRKTSKNFSRPTRAFNALGISSPLGLPVLDQGSSSEVSSRDEPITQESSSHGDGRQENGSDTDEDEEALAKAIEMSLRTANRFTANGTNLDELQRAMELSQIER